MDATWRFLPVAFVLVIASGARTSETARVGGPGGLRTVTMDCGPSAFIVGTTAAAGRDLDIGPNLLRRVRFTCRPFNGTTPGATTSQTVEAVSDKKALSSLSDDSGLCPSTHVLNELTVKAGMFIDRLQSAQCINTTQGQTFLTLNVGGDGGTTAYLECPVAEGLFKVEARVGDVIDSLKGFCRSFGSLSNLSISTQLNATASPKPSGANPTIIPVNTSKTFSFTISNFTVTSSTVEIGVAGHTDLLGGGSLNLPAFKVELLNPSGDVVASKSYSNVPEGPLYGVTFRINANGTWTCRVTNLKDFGTLNVIVFGAR